MRKLANNISHELGELTDKESIRQRDVLEILDDRFNLKSTIVASQLPISHWHEYLGEATLADAILDRLVHNAYKIQLKGESMRKKKSPLTTNPT